MNNRLTPDEMDMLKDFVKQFENDIQALSKTLDEYAATQQDKILVSDNSLGG